MTKSVKTNCEMQVIKSAKMVKNRFYVQSMLRQLLRRLQTWDIGAKVPPTKVMNANKGTKTLLLPNPTMSPRTAAIARHARQVAFRNLGEPQPCPCHVITMLKQKQNEYEVCFAIYRGIRLAPPVHWAGVSRSDAATSGRSLTLRLLATRKRYCSSTLHKKL